MMLKIQCLCGSYTLYDDFHAASIVHVVESAMVCAESRKLSWIIIEGFYSLLVQCIKVIEPEIFQKKYVRIFSLLFCINLFLKNLFIHK